MHLKLRLLQVHLVTKDLSSLHLLSMPSEQQQQVNHRSLAYHLSIDRACLRRNQSSTHQVLLHLRSRKLRQECFLRFLSLDSPPRSPKLVNSTRKHRTSLVIPSISQFAWCHKVWQPTSHRYQTQASEKRHRSSLLMSMPFQVRNLRLEQVQLTAYLQSTSLVPRTG